MTNEQKGIAADLKAAQQELEGLDQEAKPKTYTRQERLVKALEIANNQSIRASKAEKAGKKNPQETKTPKKEGANPASETKDSFDYGELAYLEAKKVSEECHKYLLEECQSTGKELKEILGYKYVKEEMEKLEAEKASGDAVPEGKKRGAGASAKASVNYWVKRGELPPNTPENQKLRRDVVNARQKQATDGSKFADNPIIQ